MAKIEAGCKLADFSFNTPFESDVKLSEKAKGAKKTILLFLRYYGCTLCQLDIREYANAYDRIKAKDAQLLVVLQSPASTINAQMKKEDLPFDIICASGENTSRPHAVPSDKIIEKGDFVTLDFGSSYNGYASDMTRTFAVGDVSDEQRRIYELVLKAQLDAMKQIKAGVRGCDIDAVARNLFAEHGVAEAFGHSLGHSLGLFIHESPNFSPKYTGIIPENAVLSDEPGLYFEGKFGVRIEDIVHVMKDGCESLTHSPKNLIIVQ